MAERLQLFSKQTEVIDLSVKCDDVGAVGRDHGLSTARDVDDGKARSGKPDTMRWVEPHPCSVGPTMLQGSSHSAQQGSTTRRIRQAEETANSTHNIKDRKEGI